METLNEACSIHDLYGMAEFDLLSLLQITTSSVQHLLANIYNIKISVESPARIPFIIGNRELLRKAFVSILENAIIYNQVNGSVQIRFEYEPTYLVVQINDTGLGIEAEYFEAIFEPFFKISKYRSLSDGSGLGLGLSTARHIIESHGGNINVDSKVGEGTCFKILLPL